MSIRMWTDRFVKRMVSDFVSKFMVQNNWFSRDRGPITATMAMLTWCIKQKACKNTTRQVGAKRRADRDQDAGDDQ